MSVQTIVKPGIHQLQDSAHLFVEIVLVHEGSVYIMCVPAPRLVIISGMMWAWYGPYMIG